VRSSPPFAALALLAVPPSASAAPRLSLRADVANGKAGQSRALSGALRDGPAGAQIRVLADEYPFEGYAVVATVKADARGGVKLSVKPPVNTRYRLALATDASTASPPLTLTSAPIAKLDTAFGDDRVLNTWTLRTPASYATAAGPQPIRLGATTAYFYGRVGKTTRYRRVGSAPLRIRNSTTVVSRVALVYTAFVRKAEGLLVCSREAPVEGMGRLAPDCGRSAIVLESG
jgi:hypothetical protein